MNRKVLLVVAGLVGLCVVAFAIMIISGLRQDAELEANAEALRTLYDPVKPVCAGSGAAETAVYSDSAGVHPIAALLSSGVDTWYVRASDLPESWRPQTTADIQLVACMVNDSVLLESCSYTIEDGSTGTVERRQSRTTITLHAAQTGAVLDSTELLGSLPQECADEESFLEGQLTKTLSGGLVVNEEKVAWLQPYVERP
ncbi:MAG: hypothetical protein R3E31_01695 [Chloroflexota bacterium]|nr:hypothetical protein [Anaerolineales bacterium]MCA9975881.1 hypothetical protein [Anaerolineales bacterium]